MCTAIDAYLHVFTATLIFKIFYLQIVGASFALRLASLVETIY